MFKNAPNPAVVRYYLNSIAVALLLHLANSSRVCCDYLALTDSLNKKTSCVVQRLHSHTQRARPVVLKLVPLGSVKEEFFFPVRKYVPGKNWEEKLDEKNLSFHYLFIQHIKLHNEVGLDGNVYLTVRKDKLL